jgi:hypothetical protein
MARASWLISVGLDFLLVRLGMDVVCHTLYVIAPTNDVKDHTTALSTAIVHEGGKTALHGIIFGTVVQK